MNPSAQECAPPSQALAAAIAAHPFTADLSPEHLQLLADVAMFVRFEKGELIFREREPANRFYLICQGCVGVEAEESSGAVLPVQSVKAGEVLGWSWLLPPYQWHFSARAAEETGAIFFYGTRLRARCDANPDFGYEILKRVTAVMAQRLQNTRREMLRCAAGHKA